MAGTAHSHGRRGAEFECPFHERDVELARRLLPPGPMLDAYEQAIAEVESLTPHHGLGATTTHGDPTDGGLDRIEHIEELVNTPFSEELARMVGVSGFPEELHIQRSKLSRFNSDWRKRDAECWANLA